ncbi:MAG: hypothetical protein CME71_11445 [Halobacteriovorax sp.]|nr:hypothetical protein [Halobacteriovorax sp.]
MKSFLKSLILLSLSLSAHSLELRPGDILLIELRCYSCSIIADETGSRFSHSGVVLGKQGNETFVAQALGRVHVTTLSNFKSQKVKSTSLLVLRPKNFSPSENLMEVFSRDWSGIPFDSNYTWDDEKLYCSEFVAKFLESFMGPVFPPKPLDFSRNWDYWSSVLNPVPQGEPGNSPGDFERSSEVEVIGEIF